MAVDNTLLTAKVVILENLVRFLFVERFSRETDPVKEMRAFAERFRTVMTDAVPSGPDGETAMVLQENIDLTFAALERWLRQNRAQGR